MCILWKHKESYPIEETNKWENLLNYTKIVGQICDANHRNCIYFGITLNNHYILGKIKITTTSSRGYVDTLSYQRKNYD